MFYGNIYIEKGLSVVYVFFFFENVEVWNLVFISDFVVIGLR